MENEIYLEYVFPMCKMSFYCPRFKSFNGRDQWFPWKLLSKRNLTKRRNKNG